jgi:glutathione S-transferase
VRSIAGMLAADTHPLITPRVRRYLTTVSGFDDAAWRAWQVQWFGTGLKAVEDRLASDSATGRFCHGNTPGMADICLASIVAVMGVFKIPTPGTPTVDRIVAACRELEPFQQADPMRQLGAPT